MNEIRLENWSLVQVGDCYTAPEMRTIALHGNVYGHPNHDEGREITTSRVVNCQGRTAKTRNTTYILGAVDPGFVAWYKENGNGEYDLESVSPLGDDE